MYRQPTRINRKLALVVDDPFHPVYQQGNVDRGGQTGGLFVL